MKNPIKLVALLLAAGLIPAAQAEPIATWYGQYVYEHGLGRIGGTPGVDSPAVFVTYTLRLGPQAGATGCKLAVEGFQTYQHLLCTATPQMNELIIKYFTMNGNGGSDRYRIGQSLLTLTRTRGALFTRWQALEGEALRNGGNQFRRERY